MRKATNTQRSQGAARQGSYRTRTRSGSSSTRAQRASSRSSYSSRPRQADPHTGRQAKRRPVKRSAPRSSGNSKSTISKLPRLLARLGIFTFIIIVAVLVIVTAASYDNTASKYRACEQWRSTVETACTETGLGGEWTDAILAAMFVESGGDTDVESVLGVKNDIMQAAEGAYGDIVKNGSEKYKVAAQTPEASIYAGALEFKQNLKLWKKYLDGITPEDSEKIQLVVQGYNFGAHGWYQWCKGCNVKKYSVDTARHYSRDEMPEGAKGTPTHAEKWLKAYEKLRSEHAK